MEIFITSYWFQSHCSRDFPRQRDSSSTAHHLRELQLNTKRGLSLVGFTPFFLRAT